MKKAFLLIVAGVIIAVSASGLQADLLKVTVVNESDEYSDGEVYVQMVGTDPGGSGKLGHVDLAASAWKEIAVGDNTVTPPGGPWAAKYTGYAKKLTELTHEGGHAWSFNTPRIISGRVYVSLGQPAYFHVNAGPALQFPSAVDPTLPNYHVVFDKVELDWENGKEPFLNTTTVDFFSISLMLELKLAGGGAEKRGFTGTRKAIMDDLAALPGAWQKGVVKNGSDVVRYAVPQILPDPNPFADYFDGYAAKCWDYYKTHTLTLQNLPDVAAWKATGQVDGGGDFVFTVDGTLEKVTIKDLAGQGKNIFGCAGAGYLFTSGGDSIPKQGIIRQMGAALNRSVLLDIKDSKTWWDDPAKFYARETTNHYSKVLHDASYQGYAYGFPYDDVGNFSSGISGDATEVVITVRSMSERHPIDLTANKRTFSATDAISVTADVEHITTPFYPAVWVDLPNGQKRYYVRGRGFVDSPAPYLEGGPFSGNRVLSGYPVLDASFTVPAGAYRLNAAAVDATRTTSIDDLVYIDGVDREDLTVHQ